MKRLALLLIITFLLPGSVMAQDDPLMLGVHDVLTNGQTINGKFTNKIGMHIYAFVGAEGDQVTITMNAGNDAVDPFLMLMDAAGEFVETDDDSGGNLDAQLEAELPDDNLYFVVATSYRSLFLPESEAGDYTLTINGASDFSGDIADVLSDPPVIEINLETNAAVEISEDNPIFLAAIPVQDAVSLEIITASDNLDTILYVFDAEGNRVGLDDDSGDNYSAYISGISLDQPGMYLVLVTDRNLLEDATFGDFQFIVRRT